MICEHDEQPESVADKVVNCIKRLDSPGSKFISTRSAVSDTSRSERCTASIDLVDIVSDIAMFVLKRDVELPTN